MNASDDVPNASDDASDRNSASMRDAAPASDASEVTGKDENLSSILDEVADAIRSRVSLTEEQVTAESLYVAMTYVYPIWYTVPYLSITAPVEAAGKSTNLTVLSALVKNGWKVGAGITKGALVRKLASNKPTLLLDEIDSLLSSDKELKASITGILNEGYQRDGTYCMNAQERRKWVPKDYNVFGPKVFAGIGRNLTRATHSRCISIEMKPKLSSGSWIDLDEGDNRERLMEDIAPSIRQKLDNWANGCDRESLKSYQPTATRNNRQMQIWRPLLAIANSASPG